VRDGCHVGRGEDVATCGGSRHEDAQIDYSTKQSTSVREKKCIGVSENKCTGVREKKWIKKWIAVGELRRRIYY
jgi:hypothetical protein